MWSAAPDRLASGRYTLHTPLGDGGMASVYRAWDERLRVWRAIKLLRPELAHSAAARHRFDQEARAMARLQHPNILNVHDVGQEDDTPYLVMDLAPGGSLADHVAQHGPMHPALACRLTEELARALAHAHELGVVHRDVKPHNVLLASDGRALVSDFGIARVLDSEAGLTRTGATVGTLAYMAPEQRGSSSTVDGKADVYAAAGTLYHLLTGREPLDLYVSRPGAFERVPPALIEWIESAVRYDPAERPTAVELADALAAIRPSLGEIPELEVAATPAPQPRRDSDTWTGDAPDNGTFDGSADAGSGTLALDEVPAVPPPPPRTNGTRTAVAGFALLGVAGAAGAAGLWWTAPTPQAPLDSWSASPPVAVHSAVYACGRGGAIAWREGEQLFAGPPGAGVAVGEAPDGFTYDVGGRLWTLVWEAGAVRAISGSDERVFPIVHDDYDDILLTADGQRAVGIGALGIVFADDGASHTDTLTGSHTLLAQLAPDGSRVAALGVADGAFSLAVWDLDTRESTELARGETLVGEGHVGVAWLADGRVAYVASPVQNQPVAYAIDPDLPGAEPTALFDLDRSTIAVEGIGDHLCSMAAPRQTLLQVVDAESFEVQQSIELPSADAIPAGWIDEDRIQIFDKGVFSIWTLSTGDLSEGRDWWAPQKPTLTWKPEDLECESGRCLALDVTARGRRFTPVDPETGEPGTPWSVTVPASGGGQWDLSASGEVAIIAANAVQILQAEGSTSRSLGELGLSQVSDVEWAPDGSLWVAGGSEESSVLLRWTPEGTRVLRQARGVLQTPVASADGKRAVQRLIDVADLRITIHTGSPDPG